VGAKAGAQDNESHLQFSEGTEFNGMAALEEMQMGCMYSKAIGSQIVIGVKEGVSPKYSIIGSFRGVKVDSTVFTRAMCQSRGQILRCPDQTELPVAGKDKI
jgi:hypothetical protein